MVASNGLAVALVFTALDEPGLKPPTVSNAEHLGLAYLAGALRARGVTAEIINAELEGLPSAAVIDRVLAMPADIVGFSPVSLSMTATLAVAAEIKRRRPGVRVVLGGHLATMCADAILQEEPVVDMVLRGEAEESLPRLVEALAGRGDLAAVPGLVHRRDGRIVHAGPGPAMVPLDGVLPPARDGLAYLRERGALTGARILASRGCQHDCSYCTTPGFYGRKVRFRPVDHVVREMAELEDRFGIRHFWFNDDLFVNGTPRNTQWIETFCGAIVGRGYAFRVLCRADSFKDANRHILGLLKEAGLVHVFLGLESGSSEALAVYNKGTTVARNRAVIALLKGHGIAVQIGFIMFNPYSTMQEVLDNAEFLHDIGELYRFFPLTLAMSVFPGTPIARRLADDGLLRLADYREPLACFAYRHAATARLVALMRDVAERHHALDAAVLAALGYDGVPGADAVRRGLADLNLRHFTGIVHAIADGRERDAAARVEPWMASLRDCLAHHGVAV